jgi:MoxR-like ATPase
MFSIHCGYLHHHRGGASRLKYNRGGTAGVNPVLDAEEIIEIQKLVRAMPVSDEVIRFAVKFVREHARKIRLPLLT